MCVSQVPLSSNAIIVRDLKLVLSTTWHKVQARNIGFWTGATWPLSSMGHTSRSSSGSTLGSTVQNASSALGGSGAPHASSHSAAYTADPGCPRGGCLFNISRDPSERLDLSQQMPKETHKLRKALAALVRARFQSGRTEPGEECVSLAAYVAAHRGFAGPVCRRRRS